MRPAILVSAVLLAAGSAAADPAPTSKPRGVGTVCLDAVGGITPAQCRSGLGSRLLIDPDICVCPGTGVREASIPYCDPGERSTPDSLAASRARDAAFRARGTLVGASFDGKRMCLDRGRSGG